jgi:hypothetical protein
MQSASQIISAKVVIAAGLPVPSQFSAKDRVRIIVMLENGQKEEIWQNAPSIIQSYQVNQIIQFSTDGKKYSFFTQANAPTPVAFAPVAPVPNVPAQYFEPVPSQASFAPVQTPVAFAPVAPTNAPFTINTKWAKLSEEQKADVRGYCDYMAEIHLHTFKKVSDLYQDMGLCDERITAITSTIFIQMNKKFSF